MADETSGTTVGLNEVVDEEVFRRARDSHPSIRQAAYDLIIMLSEHTPSCLDNIPANRLGNHIAQYTRCVYLTFPFLPHALQQQYCS